MAAAYASGLVPAVLAHTKAELDEQLSALAGVPARVHIDVMDGQFVPQRSFARQWFRTLPKGCQYQMHLMVRHPQRWLPVLRHTGIRDVILHCEAATPADVQAFRRRGWAVWLAINPGTSWGRLRPFLKLPVGVVCMGVRPGAMGRSLQAGVWRQLSKAKGKHPLGVDGGVRASHLSRLRKAGVTLVCVGSAVTKQAKPAQAYQRLVRAWRRRS